MDVYLCPDTQEITFVASKYAVVSSLGASVLFQRNNSEFGGENKHQPVIPCALIVYNLRYWKDNLY